MTQKNNYLFPLAIIGLFFFSIGFALGINSYLMPVLKNAMHISGAASSLLLAATFIPFLLFGIPATHCIRLIGYKRTMALSFAIFAACLRFVHPCCEAELADVVPYRQFRSVAQPMLFCRHRSIPT